MTETLVGKARRGQQLQTLDLSKVCPLAEGEQVEELRNVVAPRDAWHVSVQSCASHCPRSIRSGGPPIPDVVVVALLAEAGANGGALLLDHGALIGNGLGRPHVADELFY